MDLLDKQKILKIRIKLKFNLANRISLYERLIAFIQSGIPIYEAINAIKLRMAEKGDVREKMFEEWLRVMRNGGKFSEAIREWVPTSEFMLISSGENGGQLQNGLKEAATLSSAAAKIKKATRNGLTMPIILTCVLSFMLMGFDWYMAPVFIGIMPVNYWPEGARTLYGISHFLSSNWPFILLFFMVIAGVISATINTWVGSTREFFDKFPPWSLYKNYQASSFLIGLSSLLKAGVAFNDALKMMNKNSAPWLKVHINQMLARLRKGGVSLGDSMNTGLFDQETAGDISDYARLSSFENAIYTIGEKMVEDGVENTRIKMNVVQNLMLLLVACTLFWIYLTSYNLQTFMTEKLQQTKGSLK